MSQEEIPRRLFVIVNPYATTVSDRLRHLVVYALEGRFDVTAVDTERRGHAIELAGQARGEGYDLVVAFGGDGTVNEAANGLRGSSVPLTCLPGGSANVFAKLLGIPADIVDATEHLLGLADAWSPRQVDIGLVNGRSFTFASGLGLDASVVERVDANPAMKARFGPNFFAWAAVRTFMTRYLREPPRLRVEVGGRTLQGVTLVLQNGPAFSYFNDRPIELSEPTALDSGTLAVALLERAAPIDMPFILWRALSRKARVPDHRHLIAFAGATELLVSSADRRPLPLQVDGDFLGEVSEARYSILPRALTVIA